MTGTQLKSRICGLLEGGKRMSIPQISYALRTGGDGADRFAIIRVLESLESAGRIRLRPDGTWAMEME